MGRINARIPHMGDSVGYLTDKIKCHHTNKYVKF
jgi:hypothetical protein